MHNTVTHVAKETNRVQITTTYIEVAYVTLPEAGPALAIDRLTESSENEPFEIMS